MKVFVALLLLAAAVCGSPQGYGAPRRNGGASQSYGAPQVASQRNSGASQRNGGASQSYGAPQGNGGASQSYGAPQGSASQSYSAVEEEFPPQPYSFEYQVQDDEGNDYGHKEESDGSRVEGEYRVLLPDSRVQTVTYYVEGDSGYVAEVTYEGEAQFPEDSQNGQYGAAAPNSGYGAPSRGSRTPSTGYGF